MKIIKNIPYQPLVLATVLLGLAPFTPAPHAVEKIEMLFHGTLTRPVDIFDLLFHLAPAILLFFKWRIELSVSDKPRD